MNTSKLFNKEFKGFDFNVSDKKFRYSVKNTDQTAEVQSDISNFVKTFLDKNGEVSDHKGYHKALYAAMNPDVIARHFYEQGKADAIQNSEKHLKAEENGVIEETSSETIPVTTIESKINVINGEHEAKVDELKNTIIQKCPFCPIKISATNGQRYKIKLQSHLKNDHRNDKNVPRCDICHKSFVSEERLIKHKTTEKHLRKEKRTEMSFQCKFCQKIFKNFKSLEAHEGVKHERKCKYCDLRFTTKGKVMTHKVIHRRNCDLCISFCSKEETEEELLLHKKTRHWKKCNYCIEYFPTSKELEDHKNLMHQYICNICNKTASKTIEELFLHKKSSHMTKCSKCDELFPKTKEGRNDSLEHFRKTHWCKCEICDQRFKNIKDLQIHVTKAKKHMKKCKHCDEQFAKTVEGNRDFLEHIKIEHTWKCDKCDWVSPFETDLNDHFWKKHNFGCKTCGFVCDTEEKLKIHMKKEHEIKCDECDMCFTFIQELYDHIRQKHTWKCELCEKEFLTEEKLKIHIKKEHEIKCPKCDLYFPRTGSDEQRKHMKEVHWLCEHCNNVFSTSEEMKQHISDTHFICKVCHIDQLSLISLQIHNKEKHSKTEEKPVFKCDLCNEKCGSSISLKYHKQFIHDHTLLPKKKNSTSNLECKAP